MTDARDGISAPAAESDRWDEIVCAGLVLGSGAPEEELGAVRRLANRLAEDRRVFLVNLTGPGSELDRLLGVADRGGLEAVRRGERKLGQATLRPPSDRFLYLPSGGGAPRAEGSEAEVRPAEDPEVATTVHRLKEKIREAGGLLALLLRPEDLAALDPDLVDLEVGVARAMAMPGWGPPAARERSELEAAAGGDVREDRRREEREIGGESGDGEGTGEEDEPSGWRRHRRGRDLPVGRVLAAVLFLGALVGAWWLFARGAADAGSGESVAADTGGVDRVEPARPSGADVAPGSSSDTAPAAADGEPSLPDGTPELGYSVLVASYTSPGTAAERAAAWGGEGLYLVAPTPVGGRTYWRVFAGAVTERGAAETLGRRLVERGVKDTAAAWDVRPAGLAFRVGVFGTREAAATRMEELRGRGLPGYLIPAGEGARRVWLLYAGAYETREASAELGRRLREVGIEAELVQRRGEPTTR